MMGVVALLVSFTSQAGAEILDEQNSGFTLNIDDHHPGQGGPPEDLRPPGIFDNTNNNRRFHFSNTGNPFILQNRFSIEWDVVADPDPFLSVTYILKNISSQTKEYTLTANLPISPDILGGSLTSGSISVLLNDSDFDGGAILTTISSGVPIYMAKIDGDNFKALMEAPQTFQIPGGTGIGGPEHFGTPYDTPSYPRSDPITDSIEIVLNAELSAGDTATITATFFITPEPGTIALLTLGGTTMMLRRKRRRA